MNMKKTLMSSMLAVSLTVLASPNAWAEKWKMALGDASGSTQEVLGMKFAELVKAQTDGDIDIQLFPNGQLGSEQATVNDVALGTLEMSILGSNNLAPFSPSMGVLALPYIFENVDQARTVLEGEIGGQLAQDAIENANSRILAWTYSGYRMLTNSKRPVKTMEDLDGLVIRVPKNEIMIGTYNSWGLNPTPMAWSETFTALQQTVVDGQDSPYAAIASMKFGEIQQYLTELSYMYQLEPLIISESLFQAQSDEVKEILLNAGNQATEHTLAWLTEKETTIKAELKEKYGMEISRLEDEKEWAEAAQQSVWPQFYEQVGGKEKVNEILSATGRDLL